MTDEWLTVDEACDLLKISRTTLYRMRRTGQLAGVTELRVPPDTGDLRLNKAELIKILREATLREAEETHAPDPD